MVLLVSWEGVCFCVFRFSWFWRLRACLHVSAMTYYPLSWAMKIGKAGQVVWLLIFRSCFASRLLAVGGKDTWGKAVLFLLVAAESG